MPYPVLPTEYGTTRNSETDRQIDRASNGAARGRVFYTAPKSSFSITHKNLSAANLAIFEAFYLANLASSFTYVWPADGVTYSVIFAADPQRTVEQYNTTTVSVELTEV